MSPKIKGAWNLHNLSITLPLDFFIMYSSMISYLGIPGQAAYSAGNYFMDSLARYRNSLHLPALCVAWGAINETGYAARNKKSIENMSQQGFFPVNLNQAWSTLTYALNKRLINIAVFPANWAIATKYLSAVAKLPRYSNFSRDLENPHVSDSVLKNTKGQLSLPDDPSEKKKFLQKVLTKLVTDTLGLAKSELNPSEPFSSYNFDSLLAVELGVKINDIFKTEIPKISLLRTGLNMNLLVDVVLREINLYGSEVQKIDENSSEEKLNLLKEAELPEGIVVKPLASFRFKKLDKVLLTGATGFLGAFVLKDLLTLTDAKIVCLIRASNKEEALNRLVANLKKYGLWNDTYLARISILQGDLSLPMLGLESNEWDRMSHDIDSIYHCGAWLNFALPYDTLKPTNVNGTVELIKLASTMKLKQFHYISTLVVLSQTTADPIEKLNQGFSEAFLSAFGSSYIKRNGFNIGYHQSKWVGDQLTVEAGNRDIPITIYRPSLISGASQTGVWNTDDYICMLLKGFIQMKSAPKQDLFFDFCPVDYISKAVVTLSLKNDCIGNSYILKNPNPIRWEGFIGWINSKGYDIRLDDPKEWVNDYYDYIKNRSDNPLYQLLPLFEIRPVERLIIATPPYVKSLDCLHANVTQRALQGSDVKCPKADGDLLDTYYEYLNEINYLP